MKFHYKHTATAWLGVSVISIMFMGIYAFLVALSRAPGFNLLFSDQNFFKTALVTHVVLSVVIWFLAFILFVMYYVTSDKPVGTIDYIPPMGAATGIALIVITPFTGPAFPMLNNYVPVLQRGLYFTGLGLFLGFTLAGAVVRAKALAESMRAGSRYPAIVTASLAGAGVSLAFGVACFVISLIKLYPLTDAKSAPMFYESLFWGGGHVLQFANTMGLMAVWGLLAGRIAYDKKIVSDKIAYIVLGIMTAFVLFAPVEYFIEPISTMENRWFFLNLKRWGTALGPIVLGVMILVGIRGINIDMVARRGLYLSITLFYLGGLIALTIHGSDTRVPAHYHGVIGAVTLCFMALAIITATDNGWLDVGEKWQKAQLTLYGAGQTLFVTGLFIGGMGGLPRKTFGAAQKLDSAIKYTGMSVMGIGGLLAVSGGVIFVVFMLRALWGGRGK